MATATEHAEVVLSGILPDNKARMEKALRRLTPEHFSDKKQSNLFRFIERYADSVSSVLPRQYLDDLLSSRIEEAQYLTYMEMYDLYANKTIEDSEFHWSVEQLRELAAEKATGEALAEAMEILKKGKEIKRGVFLKGHAESRERLVESISVIDRELDMSDAPEGFIQDEEQDMIAEYLSNKERRLSGQLQGIGFGVENLDNITGGMQRGELCLVVASSSAGKSSLAVQSAWHASVNQGANVVFFSTETGRTQTRRKIIARHSKLEKFGLPEGINTRAIKEGTLTDREEESLRHVVSDLSSNKDYGKFHLAQLPEGTTISALEHKINRISRNLGCDFVVIDYITLLAVVSSNMDERQKQVNTLRSSKLMAVSVADGLGVPVLSPWQINRDGQNKADTSGYYTMTDLADTSEAEKTSDLIVSIRRETEDTSRYADANAQILKARDGERSNDIPMSVDYATCTFTAKEGLLAPRALTDKNFSLNSLESLY